MQYLFPSPSVNPLASTEAAFPTVLNETGAWQSDGYRIDSDTGLPVFVYQRGGRTLEDYLRPDETGKTLTRTLTFAQGTPEGDYLKLAEGDSITRMANGHYVVDQQYYIQVPEGQAASVRTVDQKQELVAPLEGTSYAYSIIW